MNSREYTNNKYNEGDIATKESIVSFYVSQQTKKANTEQDFKTFTKVEPGEPPRQRIKKRRAYERPLL